MIKTRFLILFFFVLNLNLFSQSAKYLIDKDSILIGQQIRFTVELNDIELTNNFPQFNPDSFSVNEKASMNYHVPLTDDLV